MGIEAALIAAGASATAASLASTAVGIGLSVGLAYASKALTGKSRAAEDKGVQASLQIGADVPRGYLCGRQVMEGQLSYWNVSGPDNNFLDLVFPIGDGPHDGLTDLWVDGVRRNLTLASSDQFRDTYSVESYYYGPLLVPLMTVTFYHGYEDQPAHDLFVSSATPASRWTATERGSGVAYVAIRLWYFKQWFPDGIPSFKFGIRGRRFYDWRKDSTAGGSGAHRWTDKKTWAYTENPFVELYNFQRGLYLNNELVVGAGVLPADLLLDRYTAAANACDEEVMDSAGFSADRFSCSTYVNDDEEHGAVTERILDSCAGAMYEQAGSFGPIAGVAQPTVMTITDGDLVSGRPVSFKAKLPRSELVNGVFGTYIDFSQMGAAVPYVARTDAAAESADTEQRRVESNFPQVNDLVQAQRLAEIEKRLARLQATATITLGMSADPLEPGDWIRWISARPGRGDRRYLIKSLTKAADQTITLNLREVASSAFGAAANDDAPSAGDPNAPPAVITTVPMFNASPRTLLAENGLKTPAIEATWQSILDDKVDAVLIQYRVAGQEEVLPWRSDDPLSGLVVWSSGVQSETLYEVRATITCTPARATTWTEWKPVTTTEQVVPVTMQSFAPALRDLIGTQLGVADAEYRAGIENLNLIVAELAAHQAVVRLEDVRRVTATFGNQKAEYLFQVGVVADDVSATVQRVETLEAEAVSLNADLGTVTTNLATVSSTVTALADGQSALASDVTSLQSTTTGLVTGLDAAEGNIGDLTTGLGAAEGTIGGLQSDVAAAQGDIGTLVTSVATAQGSLTTLTGTVSAISADVLELTAAVNDLSSSVTVRWVAGVTPAGATAAWDLQLVAGSVVVGMSAIALSGGGGQIRFQADKFLFAKPDGTTFALLQSSGGTFYLAGNMLTDGYVLAQHLSVSTLSAITGNMGTLTVGRMLSTNGKVDFNLTDTYLLFKD
ncbi:hypothetical protein V5F77_20510 [Xanthobacter sp. DSM 24535]|uniref:hypothetical protein n=1 Tax=Roseixanthobacter psychrophilus TaxID=3119917 RepID=UPI003729E750